MLMPNGFTSEQDEALTIMQEELTEAALAISKIRRHGNDSMNPDMPGTTNLNQFRREFAQVMIMAVLCGELGALPEAGAEFDVEAVITEKLSNLKRYSNLPHDAIDKVVL